MKFKRVVGIGEILIGLLIVSFNTFSRLVAGNINDLTSNNYYIAILIGIVFIFQGIVNIREKK